MIVQKSDIKRIRAYSTSLSQKNQGYYCVHKKDGFLGKFGNPIMEIRNNMKSGVFDISHIGNENCFLKDGDIYELPSVDVEFKTHSKLTYYFDTYEEAKTAKESILNKLNESSELFIDLDKELDIG